jgi:hypothetical protein
MKHLKRILVVASTASLLASCGPKGALSQLREAWNPANDPLRFLPADFERSFDALPTTATLEKTPWSDTYWPTTDAGIAQRWNDSSIYGEANFSYMSPTLEQLQAMSPADIAKLSPAEKFDILNGDYNYTLQKEERSRTRPDAESWEGLCHGWASAALTLEEPKAVTIKNPQGIDIPVGSADVKGLIDLYNGNYSYARVYFVADRCDVDISNEPEAANSPECRDTNAGTFHLVLTNQIAKRKQGFVADVVRDLQVWNHPVYGYTSEIISQLDGASAGAAAGTVREVTIKTTMNYVSETGPNWEHGRINERQREYNYRVEINQNGQIIGGEWLDSERPDFLWMQDAPQFANMGGIKFSTLGSIYETSRTAQDDIPNPARP